MRVLYLLHTDWNWIKQRSQFLAENLNSLNLDVSVAYKFSFKRRSLVRNATPVRVFPCLFLPFGLRPIWFLGFIDRVFWRSLLFFYVKFTSTEAVVVTHPLLREYIPKNLGLNIVYDCHDDNGEFYKPGSLQNLILAEHKQTLKIAQKVVFSSKYLQKKYDRLEKKSTVVRNGHNLSQEFINNPGPNSREIKDEFFHIYYFGTVSQWFDQELLVSISNYIPRVRFTIIGPCDVPKALHPSITFIEAKPHKELIELCRSADAFIMPFEVNELIMGVDPVKLYEYIGFNVPVVSVFYDELAHFRPHIKFYSDQAECIDLIAQMVKTSDNQEYISAEKDRKEFLRSSSWSSRAIEMLQFLES